MKFRVPAELVIDAVNEAEARSRARCALEDFMATFDNETGLVEGLDALDAFFEVVEAIEVGESSLGPTEDEAA